MKNENSCWLCASVNTHVIFAGDIRAASPADMRITDAAYGDTLPRWQCADCKFIFCPDLVDPVALYQSMEDDDYELTRIPRAAQANRLFRKIKRYAPAGRWFDIGAGSGIFMEVGQRQGIDIDGIEPSTWAVAEAAKRGISIVCGSLPHSDIKEKYAAITCIDVIEHVDDPVDLLTQIEELLEADGHVLLVTPDVSSIAARLLGKKWWHYRVAHIGYFNRRTLNEAMRKSGLEAVYWQRPTWYFPVSYLLERLAVYLPLVKKFPCPKKLLNLTVPLNLLDSWLVVAKKKKILQNYDK